MTNDKGRRECKKQSIDWKGGENASFYKEKKLRKKERLEITNSSATGNEKTLFSCENFAEDWIKRGKVNGGQT